MSRNCDSATAGVRILFHEELIHIAPEPVLSGLKRFYDRVFGGVEMFCGMLVFGTVAAPNVTAGQAEPQVHPCVTHLQALFAARAARHHFLNLLNMSAGRRHLIAPLDLVLAGLPFETAPSPYRDRRIQESQDYYMH